MIIVLRKGATEEQIQDVSSRLLEEGLNVHLSRGVEKVIVGAIGDRTRVRGLDLEALPWVEKVMPIGVSPMYSRLTTITPLHSGT